MDRKFQNDKFRAEWQMKRINECQKGMFSGFHVPNFATDYDRGEEIINLSKLYRLHLQDKEDRINILSESADQDAIYQEFREWWDDKSCEIITSKTEYVNLKNSDFSIEIESKTYFAEFRFVYTKEQYDFHYLPF